MVDRVGLDMRIGHGSVCFDKFFPDLVWVTRINSSVTDVIALRQQK